MEKRFTLFLVLTILVLVGWHFLFAPPPPPPPVEPAQKDNEAAADPAAAGGAEGAKPAVPPPAAGSAEVVDPAAVQQLTLENERLRLSVSTAGAVITTADVLDHHPTAKPAHREVPLRVIEEYQRGRFALALEGPDGDSGSLGRGLWRVVGDATSGRVAFEKSVPLGGEHANEVIEIRKELELAAGTGRWVRVKLSFGLPGEKDGRAFTRKYRLHLTGGVHLAEGEMALSLPRAAISQIADGEEEPELKIVGRGDLEAGETGERLSVRGRRRFIAELSNYFGVFLALREFPASAVAGVDLLVPDGAAEAGDGSSGDVKSERTTSFVEFSVDVPRGGVASCEGLLYVGPTDAQILAPSLEGSTWLEADGGGEIAADLGLVHEQQLGWASFIADTVLWALHQLHGLTGNWGWAIVLLTLCVRALLFPINRRSQGAMMRHGEAMARLKPKIEALREKFKNEPQKVAAEQMRLMKAEGVPMVPLGGCLPVLLQLPIFFGLFSALRSSISLVGAPWLWVKDLSQPDQLIEFRFDNPLTMCGGCCGIPQPEQITGLHILPLLMTAAWVGSSMMMPKPTAPDPQVEQQRKIMMFMPLVMGLFMYSYAAALSLYWLTSSLLGMFETKVIKRFWPVKPPPARVPAPEDAPPRRPPPPGSDALSKGTYRRAEPSPPPLRPRPKDQDRKRRKP